MVQSYHKRLAEIWIIKRTRVLTLKEAADFAQCMDLNEGYVNQMVMIQNFSMMAHMTNDKEWQDELRIESDLLVMGKTHVESIKKTS